MSSNAGAPPPQQRLFWRLLLSFFSGIGTAIVVLLLTNNTIAVETKTVRGRPLTQIRVVHLSPGAGEPCSGSTVPGGPPYEPNEVVAAAYGPLRDATPVEAALESSEDVDYYAFCLTRTTVAEVRLSETGCRLFAPVDEYEEPWCERVTLAVFDDRGRQVEGRSLDESEATLLTISRRLRAGRYYVRVGEGNGFRYQLRVDASSLVDAVPRE